MSKYDNFKGRGIKRKVLNNIFSKELAYLYGILIGNGNITPIFNKKRGHRTHLIQLVTKSKIFCQFFLRTANKILGTHYASIRKRKDGYWRTYLISNALAHWFFTINAYKLVNFYPIDFLRGFYESDGSIDGNRITLANTEKWKLELAKRAIMQIGLPRMNWYKRKYTGYGKGIIYCLRKCSPKFKTTFLKIIKPIIKKE